jgi:hypothetical protein
MLQAVVYLLTLALAAPHLAAQVQSGRIEGTVQDPTGAVVPGATLSVVNLRTQNRQEAESDASGYYIFPLLPNGLYTLSAERAGFRRATIANIELNLGVTLRQDISLEIGAVTDSVVVEASAVRVQSTEATIQRAITLRDIDTLPQLARNPIVLSVYQPGVQINPADPSFSRINGLRQGSNNNTLDGIDVNDPVLPRLGLALNAVNVDSIEEFRIITNGAKAEYGRNGGGQIELITRSGTNEFHGNLFQFHRNTVFNANNFFNKSAGVEIPRPKFIQNQFGGSLGGPVRIPKLYNGRDKLFFFFNYQGSRTAQEVVRNRTVLTPEARRGIFRWRVPGTGELRSFNILAADPRGLGLDPAVAHNLAMVPEPNNFDIGDHLNTAGFRFNAPNNNTADQYTLKTDYNLTPSHRLSFRYSWFRTFTPGDALNGADKTFPGQPAGSQGGARTGYAINSSWTLKPWLVNELIVGESGADVEFARVRSLFPGQPLIAANLFTNPIPTAFGSSRFSPVFQITDNLSILRGKHSFKTGFRFSNTLQWSRVDADIWPTVFLGQGNGNAAPGAIGPSGAALIIPADRLRFDNLYNDLLGRVSNINATFYSDLEQFQPAGTPRVRNFTFRDHGYYFQDDWRIRRNLVLNLGLRYEFFGVPFERDRLQGVVLQQAAGLLHHASNIADLTIQRASHWYANDWNNFAPRIGFAWSPGNGGKTAIRASWGVFYDRVVGATANDVDGTTPGFAQLQQVFPNQAVGADNRLSTDRPALPSAPAAPVLTPPANRVAPTLAQFGHRFRTPYVLQTNFTIQHEVFRNTVVEVGYVGNRGIQQLMDVNMNQPRIYGGFLDAFTELNRLRANTPASNALVAMFGGNAAQAVSTIGATNLAQGNVGLAATIIDNGNFARYPRAGLDNFFLRNFPQFQNVVVATNAGRTQYDSMQASIRRQTGSLRFALNYTWSKTIDNASTDGSGFAAPIDSFNLALSRGRSDIDRPHTFNWTASYFLPIGRNKALFGGMPGWLDHIAGGWEIGTLGFWTSGPVMTVSSGLATGPAPIATWANYAGDRNIGAVTRFGGGVRFFSAEQAAQFSVPAAGFVGTSGRNTFRGPRFFNTDVSLVKRFRVSGERTFVTFRAEGYNIFNNANFAAPGLNLQTPPTFGIIAATTGNPRILQFALRFDF